MSGFLKVGDIFTVGPDNWGPFIVVSVFIEDDDSIELGYELATPEQLATHQHIVNYDRARFL